MYWDLYSQISDEINTLFERLYREDLRRLSGEYDEASRQSYRELCSAKREEASKVTDYVCNQLLLFKSVYENTDVKYFKDFEYIVGCNATMLAALYYLSGGVSADKRRYDLDGLMPFPNPMFADSRTYTTGTEGRKVYFPAFINVYKDLVNRDNPWFVGLYPGAYGVKLTVSDKQNISVGLGDDFRGLNCLFNQALHFFFLSDEADLCREVLSGKAEMPAGGAISECVKQFLTSLQQLVLRAEIEEVDRAFIRFIFQFPSFAKSVIDAMWQYFPNVQQKEIWTRILWRELIRHEVCYHKQEIIAFLVEKVGVPHQLDMKVTNDDTFCGHLPHGQHFMNKAELAYLQEILASDCRQDLQACRGAVNPFLHDDMAVSAMAFGLLAMVDLKPSDLNGKLSEWIAQLTLADVMILLDEYPAFAPLSEKVGLVNIDLSGWGMVDMAAKVRKQPLFCVLAKLVGCDKALWIAFINKLQTVSVDAKRVCQAILHIGDCKLIDDLGSVYDAYLTAFRQYLSCDLDKVDSSVFFDNEARYPNFHVERYSIYFN